MVYEKVIACKNKHMSKVLLNTYIIREYAHTHTHTNDNNQKDNDNQ